jgi:hypothetical protein
MGNIGNTALFLTKKISAAGILFCGMDFMCIPGSPHARGAYSMTDHLCKNTRLTSSYRPLFAPNREHRRIKEKSPYYTDSVMESYVPAFRSMLEGIRFFDFNPNSFFGAMPGFSQPEELIDNLCPATDFVFQGLSPDASVFADRIKEELRQIHKGCLDFLLHGREIPLQTSLLFSLHDELTAAFGDTDQQKKKGRDYYSRLAVLTSRFLQCFI